MMRAALIVLAAHALVPPPRRIARSPARRAQSAAADAAEKTWRSRRRLARAAFDARCAWDRAAAQAELEREDEEDLDVVQSTVSTTAFGVVLVALVVRFGGRAALLQVLGLDVGADFAATSNHALFRLLPKLPRLVMDIAWIVEGRAPEALPENVLAAMRLNHLDFEAQAWGVEEWLRGPGGFSSGESP